MASREEKIAFALQRAKSAAEKHIIKTNQLSRADRELLIASGWLQEIIRGWYMLVCPDVAIGDTAAWYANYWDFIALYLYERFGEGYCLSVDASLEMHTEKSTVPKQLIIMATKGAGVTELMHGLSLMVYTDKKNFPDKIDITKKNNINLMALPYALCKATPRYFQKKPAEAELALRSVTVISDLIRVLAHHDWRVAASRLAGAYKFLGNQDFALDIQAGLKKLGIAIGFNNPFLQPKALLNNIRLASPYAGRIRVMWQSARDVVAEVFPEPPGLAKNKAEYLKNIDAVYQFDAYNSLSIEGYQVSHALIESVKSRQWQPEINPEDCQMKDAMAARGYFDAFVLVKQVIEKVLDGGESSAKLIKTNLQEWYQALFGPSVKAGLIPAASLFGYRNDRVFIKNSLHSPPPKEAVLDAMDAFFDCLALESHPGVRAVLGHYFFVFIHPYMDGNGRIGRFLMNTLLAEGGYPWTVVRMINRDAYFDALESSHDGNDLKAFAQFIKSEMLS